MFTFLRESGEALSGAGLTVFMGFFAYVWMLWSAKALAARRYRPWSNPTAGLSASVIVPVYSEPVAVFRRSLESVVANGPKELIAVVDGGDTELAAVAADYCDRVISIPKSGKRAA